MANKVILIGNVGQDPKLTHTASGTPVVNLSLATSEKWKDSDGNPQERTTWHNLFMFGNRAETIAKYVKSGDKLAITDGAIRNDKYEKDGVTMYSSKVEIRDFEFIGGIRNEVVPSEPSQKVGQAKEAGTPSPRGRKATPRVAAGTPEEDGGDLPF